MEDLFALLQTAESNLAQCEVGLSEIADEKFVARIKELNQSLTAKKTQLMRMILECYPIVGKGPYSLSGYYDTAHVENTEGPRVRLSRSVSKTSHHIDFFTAEEISPSHNVNVQAAFRKICSLTIVWIHEYLLKMEKEGEDLERNLTRIRQIMSDFKLYEQAD